VDERDAPPAAERFPCAGCGADMAFDPATRGLKCPYCGMALPPPPADGAVPERAFEAYLRPDASRLARLSAKAVQVDCAGCGSVVTFEPPEVAGLCPFCGGKIVAQPRAADPLIAPEGVLPFQITEREAAERIRQWIRTRWFAPNALKEMARHGAVHGVYLPFWSFDSDTHTLYIGQRGDYYWTTEKYRDRDGTEKTRQVRHTRWRPAAGSVVHAFDDVLVSATKSLPREHLDTLEPWDLSAVKPYAPAYLSGFKAQRYQVELPAGFAIARKRMDAVIEGLVRRDIGGDEQRIFRMHVRCADIRFKHLLLPVWVSAYRYEGKPYQALVNARTGDVRGDRPYSVWKILFAVLLAIAAVALFLYWKEHRPEMLILFLLLSLTPGSL
jgi:DNA-directed RNA polymerase subunit RPC12/RpoP